MNKEEIKKMPNLTLLKKAFMRSYSAYFNSNDKKRLEEIIAKYNEEIVELEKKLKQQDIFPQDKDIIYFITINDQEDYKIIVSWVTYYNNEDKFINSLIAMGNYYQTKEKAEKVRDQQLAIVKIKTYIKETFGYDPDDWAGWINWYDKRKDKYFISGYNYNINVMNIEAASSCLYKKTTQTGYFQTRKQLEEIKEKFPKELDLIYK